MIVHRRLLSSHGSRSLLSYRGSHLRVNTKGLSNKHAKNAAMHEGQTGVYSLKLLSHPFLPPRTQARTHALTHPPTLSFTLLLFLFFCPCSILLYQSHVAIFLSCPKYHYHSAPTSRLLILLSFNPCKTLPSHRGWRAVQQLHRGSGALHRGR